MTIADNITRPHSLKYREEIDGLRAFAVIPVILFHAGLSSFDSGFIGVDVFFVISGFLITSIIIKEMHSEKFTLSSFYERRLRRIAPILLFVVLTCIPFAWLLMTTKQFNEFSIAVGSIPSFSSNFLFWSQVDYFATSAEINPLLHTWSLAIEEQYYMLFPLLLIFIRKKSTKTTIVILSILMLLSLLYTEIAWRKFPAANFYLFPSRIWELLVGSIAAFLMPYVSKVNIRRNNIYSLFGFVLLLFSYIWMDEQTPFPSIYATMPIFGTAFILIFSGNGSVVKALLSIGPLIFIGRISYSLYLWHLPVFAFSRLNGVNTAEPIALAILLSFLLIISYLSWRLIENPFRKKDIISSKPLIFGTLIIASSMVGFASYGHFVGFTHPDMAPEGALFLKTYKGSKFAIPLYREDCNFYYHNEIAEDCLQSQSTNVPVTLIWGDSHAQALALGLRHNFGEQRFFAQLATSACVPAIVNVKSVDLPPHPENNKAFKQACLKANATAIDYLKNKKVESIVINLKQGFKSVEWDEIIHELEKYNVKTLYIVGPVPQWDPSLPHAYAMQLGHAFPANINHYLSKKTIDENNYLNSLIVNSSNVEVIKIHPFEFLCRGSKSCDYLVPGAPEEDRLMSFDYGHLSYSGSIYLSKELFSGYFVPEN